MRLIDAEALKASLPEPKPNNNGEQWTYRVLCDFIDNAPTVVSDYELGYSEGVHDTERPQGEWKEKTEYNGDTYYDCSVCGNSWTTIEGTPWDNGMNYCPNCGADMRKETDNEV